MREYTIESEMEVVEPIEQIDNPKKGRVGVIVRLAVMLLTFGYFTWFQITHMAGRDLGVYQAIGEILSCFAMPGLVWLIAKGISLVTPVVKAIWKWEIPIGFIIVFSWVPYLLKLVACAVITLLPAMLILNYALLPFLNLVNGVPVVEVIVMLLLVAFTVVAVWIDINKFKGRTFLQAVKNLFSKKDA